MPRSAWSIGLLALVLAFPPTLRAEEPIKVTVLTILADTKKNEIDERIREIAEEVQKKQKDLIGFSLDHIERITLEKGKTLKYALVDKEVVEVTVNEQTDEKGRITLTIKPPTIAEIKYACCCGKYFPIITDYYTANGERLIIAIMAKPCMKKP